MTEIKLYSVSDVSDVLQVTTRTVYNYIKQGDLKASRIGKYLRIQSHDLQAFIDAGTK